MIVSTPPVVSRATGTEDLFAARPLPKTPAGLFEALKEQGVRFVHFEYSDAYGVPYSITYPIARAAGVLEKGCFFDGSSIPGFTSTEHSDLMLRPDLKTACMVPSDSGKEARVICDVVAVHAETGEQTLYAAAPRTVLRQAQKALKDGYGARCIASTEIEFFLKPTVPEKAAVLSAGERTHYTLHYSKDPALLCKKEILETLEAMGLEPEKFHGEVANIPGGASQHEITLRPQKMLRAADNLTTAKAVIASVARKHGYEADFSPKPYPGVNGTGGHLNHSLQSREDGRNLFADAEKPYALSSLGRCFAKGVEEHLPEIMAVTNAAESSWDRLKPGFETPINIGTGPRNRSCAIRVPLTLPPDLHAVRLEARFTDLTASPYEQYAMVLAAGLDGMEKGVEAALHTDNLWHVSAAELAARGVCQLPASREEAVDLFSHSSWVPGVFGEEYHCARVAMMRASSSELHSK